MDIAIFLIITFFLVILRFTFNAAPEITGFNLVKTITWLVTGGLFASVICKMNKLSDWLLFSLISCICFDIFIFLYTDNFEILQVFKGIAHFFVGGLFALWIFERKNWQIGLFLGLFLFELLMFLLH